MKKIGIIAGAIALVIGLCSCGPKPNANGWYQDFEQAKKACGSSKSVFLLVTSEGDPVESAAGIKAITEAPDFAKALNKSFVCCHFDFSQAAIDETVVQDGATEKEQKAAENKKKAIQKRFETATMYAVENTPTVVIISSEGYWINSVNLPFESDSVDGYIAEIKEYENDVAQMKAYVAATKKGSKVEKVQAIDKLFNTQPEACQIFMKDLVKKVPAMDKKNESGLVGKYIVASANSDAYDCIVKGNVQQAADILAKSAKNPLLAPTETQSLYYFAANILAQSNSSDFDTIIDLLNKAIEVDAESPYNDELKKIIDYVQDIKQKAGESQPLTQEEPAAQE